MSRGSPKEPTTEYGQRLRDARKYAKLTQAGLAAVVSLTQATIGELERKGMGSRHTEKLAAACKVRAEWLARGEGPMLPQTLSQEMVNAILPLDRLTGEDRIKMLETLRNLGGLVRAPTPAPVPDRILLHSPKAKQPAKKKAS